MTAEALVAPADFHEAIAGKPLRHGAERDLTAPVCPLGHRLARQHQPK